jgi:hypothetical protein
MDSELRSLAKVGGIVAAYCDHVEHAEPADSTLLAEGGRQLRELALALAAKLDVDAIDAYGRRLAAGEEAYVLGQVEGFDAAAHVSLATTWRDLQLIQGRHDRLYRPDVAGLSRADQLRHCSIHLSKLVGALADLAVSEDQLRERIIPDVLLFGIKLATIAGDVLPEAPVGTGGATTANRRIRR